MPEYNLTGVLSDTFRCLPEYLIVKNKAILFSDFCSVCPFFRRPGCPPRCCPFQKKRGIRDGALWGTAALRCRVLFSSIRHPVSVIFVPGGKLDRLFSEQLRHQFVGQALVLQDSRHDLFHRIQPPLLWSFLESSCRAYSFQPAFSFMVIKVGLWRSALAACDPRPWLDHSAVFVHLQQKIRCRKIGNWLKLETKQRLSFVSLQDLEKKKRTGEATYKMLRSSVRCS